ncbi:MAG: HEAT repeat domain-containing protein [Halorientalis sp.]
MTLVFAFDRDWTVDVNPHPRHAAVPLEWVEYLAHETDHAVYAIGNQTLAEEAAIPGVVDIVGRHSDEWDEWLGGKQPDGYYERFPTRRERLALIEDLHPNADGYVVIDDLDLSDVDGWDHYHAWEFVPAVEQGDIDPALPWVRDVVTDGGRPTAAGIVPVDASHLSTFLDEYGETPGFELTFVENGETTTGLLWNVSLLAATGDDPSTTPAVRCTPVAPDGDRFTVPVDAVEKLSVVEPPLEAVIARAKTPTERATAFRRVADVDPDAVRVSSILTLLDCEETTTLQQRDAVRALRSVAAARPEECLPAVPILRSLLGHEDLASPTDALATLRAIGESSPGDIAPATSDIIPYLDSERVPARREAAACLAPISREFPSDAVDAIPGLVTVVEDGVDGQGAAVSALNSIASELPEAAKPAAQPLGDATLNESLADDIRLTAAAALGSIVHESPSVAVDTVDDIAQLCDADNYKLRNNAVALLFDVAAVHTDVVEPYVDDIAALLTVNDAYTRTNASGTISRVAEDFPDSVAHLTPTFTDLLTDDDPRVRENACWTLGYLRAADAESALATRAQQDSIKTVQVRAEWALSQINRRGARDD